MNGVPVDTPSFFGGRPRSTMNGNRIQNQAITEIIRGGIDLFAVSPVIPAGASVGVTMSMVANAPIPQTDGDFVQVSRDVINSILDEAEHLAQFKEAGQEFQESMILHQRFIKAAMSTNKRLAMSGIFATDLRRPISKEDEAEPMTSTLSITPPP